MKTRKRIKTFLPLMAIVILAYFTSCSKDRIAKQVETSYAPTDAFYTLNAPPEQTFVIDSLGGDTITAMHGTKIWGVPKTIFMLKSTHQDIYYPFYLKLIEAYSLKDMILSRLPNVAQSKILKDAGELKVTAFKDTNTLVLKDNCGLPLWAPSSTPDSSMNVYYGFTNGTTNDWNINVTQTDYLFSNDTVTHIGVKGSGYSMKITKLGWVDIGHLAPYSNASMTFTSAGTNTNYIDVYIVFNNRHSFIKVNSLAAHNLPSGEPITVFALAMDSGGQMYFFKQNYNVANGMVIPLQMTQATSAQVLAEMSTL